MQCGVVALGVCLSVFLSCPHVQPKGHFPRTVTQLGAKLSLRTHLSEFLGCAAREHRILSVQLSYGFTSHDKMKVMPWFQVWSLIGNTVGVKEVTN